MFLHRRLPALGRLVVLVLGPVYFLPVAVLLALHDRAVGLALAVVVA